VACEGIPVQSAAPPGRQLRDVEILLGGRRRQRRQVESRPSVERRALDYVLIGSAACSWSTIARVTNPFLSFLRSWSLPGRGAVLGMIVVGVPGAIVGLVIGLNVHAQTAWAAMLEIGIPDTILGGLVGSVIWMGKRFKGHRAA